MEGSILDKQRTFRIQSYIFQTVQLTRDILQDDEQYFRKLLYEGVLANYIDDFVIPAKTKKELEKQTICFLKIAEKHNLYFK